MSRLLLLACLAVAACSKEGSIRIQERGAVGEPESPAAMPALALAPDGGLLLFVQEGGRTLARRITDSGLAPPEAASAEPPERFDVDSPPTGPWQAFSSMAARNGLVSRAGERLGWSPGWAETAAGVHWAYDRADAGDFDVIHRAPDGTETVVAGTAAYEAHPSLAVDADGKLWLAWDEGREGWGHGTGLHLDRELRLAVLQDGVWHAPPRRWPPSLLEPDSSPRRAAGAAADPDAPLAPRPADLAELPQLVADEDGPLWVFYRVMTTWPSNEDRSAARRVLWQIRALALTHDGWLGPVTLPGSDGPNHDTLAVLARPGGGVVAAYESDHRLEHLAAVEDWPEPLMTHTTVRVVALSAGGGVPGVGEPIATGRRAPAAAAGAGSDPDPDPDLVPPGFRRFWGDLHRHSDLSRCKTDTDGSVVEQYRYARDVAGLDFLALTDHFQHMTPPVWSFLQRMAERFHEPGRFTTLHGFERAMLSGHRNVICLDPEVARPAPFFEIDLEDEWKDFRPEDWVVIPHQLADRFGPVDPWTPDPELEPVIEIYQGRRGSYEAEGAPLRDFGALDRPVHAVDRLEQGGRFGFIASSDHDSTQRAFAAVLARDNTREALFEAFKARRTYAATTRMALDVRLGNLLMGEAGPVDPDAALWIRADAGGEIARVEVLRNGRVAHAWQGEDDGSGLLTYRLGRSQGRRETILGGRGVTYGDPVALFTETEDTVVRDAAGRVVLQAGLDTADDDGVVVPVRFGPDSNFTMKVSNARGKSEVAVAKLEELAGGAPLRFRFLGGPHEIQLGPPPLGGRRFEERWEPGDWKPGDWVYVRLVRADGQMAWSSPVWVE